MFDFPTITTSPDDGDFWDKVKAINTIHPLAVPEHWRALIHVRCGAAFGGSQPSLVTLKRVVFKSGGQKMFQSLKRRPRDARYTGPELIECDGHRLEIGAIARIEVELLEYNPYNWWENNDATHHAGHNAMTAVYDSHGDFMCWQCACGYRYEKEKTT